MWVLLQDILSGCISALRGSLLHMGLQAFHVNVSGSCAPQDFVTVEDFVTVA